MEEAAATRESGGPKDSPLESTATLLRLVRQGDERARERLFQRFIPVLRCWAHGRLPARARGLLDTDDLVQLTLIRALNRLGDFESRHEGAFLAYLRRILLNRIRDEIRSSARRPERDPLDEALEGPGPSPVEQAIGHEALERYETALSGLPRERQQAAVLRVEFGFTYEQIAQALGRPSANAARKLVTRALLQLARQMHE